MSSIKSNKQDEINLDRIEQVNQELVLGKRHQPCKGKTADLKTVARKLGFNMAEREHLHRLYVELAAKAEKNS